MSRLEITAPDKAQLVIEGLYKDLERRIESSPPGLCPVDMTRAFLEMCHTHTCGKCVPCRIGLWQLKNLLTDVMNGDATMETLDLMEELAVSIMEGADCAIGYEAAHMVYKSLMGCREDYEEHIRQGRCTCQYTQPVPCVALCPAHVDIPGYIALVGEGRYADAIRLIRKDNPFPTTCGFICEHPCEARCRRNIVDDAVNIRGLKRMAADYAGKVPPPPCGPSTGKRVAVVGGGPGGLSAAYYLQLMGHQVTVFEMLPKLGGMLRYGIPNYRLPKDRLDDDINAILETGVKVEFGKRIGQDMTIQSLREEYDAVLITIGASTDKKLGIDGEQADGVLSAVQFLRAVGKEQHPDLAGQDVAVIGGGNVSMDAVRTAKRLGAKKVSIVYRRRTADMTALPAEIEGAIAEGIEVQTLMAPSRIEVDENNHVQGIYVTPQMISKIKDGRASVRPTGEPDVFIPCQTLIVAIGQDIEFQHFSEAGVPVERGKILTQKYGGFDNIPGVFAGGDCASGPATVIKAIAAAKVVAANIDEYLGFHHEIGCDVEIPEARLDDRPPCGRVNLTEREACERVCDFNGVENCMTEAEAKQEAGRCLRCDHFGYGIFKGGREKIMVNITIDNQNISVPEGTTIMEAAAGAGIPIPKLCYLKDINEIAACRVCVVELEGMERLVTSCNNVVKEGMVIYTNSPKVREARRNTVQLILSQHDCKCATCVRSGNCSLQKLANDLNILDVPFKTRLEDFPWDKDFPLIRDSKKCIKCMRCIQVCDKIQDLHIWDVTSTGSRTTVNVTGNKKITEVSCSLCGQCITHCPVGALRERDDTEKVWDAIADKKKVVVAQVAPAVRAAWGEALGLSREEATVGKIMDSLKRLGVDYVFDTTFSADLTIMEEGNEFLERFTKGELKLRPMFTSCCPGWIRFIKSQYPHLVPQLSTAKSPQQMFGAVMKTYFAQSIGVAPEDIFTVSIMPCVAKKGESNMELFYGEYAGHDTDVVLTTRELTRMIRSAHIEPSTLVDRECDPLMKEGSGAGVIFGATGGVMEAALRSAHYLVTGKNPDPDAFKIVRSPAFGSGVIEAEVTIGDAVIRAAVVSGLGNTRKLIEAIEHGEVHYDFVEVMACPGGCVGGGGQPIHDGEELAHVRGENLYFLDKNAKLRFSHENPDVLKLYTDFMEKPLSHKSHMLLHTDHNAWEMPR